MTTDQKSVLAAVEKMTSAFQAGDISTVMEAYEPGAVVAFEPGIALGDATKLAEMFAMMAAVNPRFDYAGHEVLVSGDVAVHIAPWSMTGTAPDGQKIEQSGLSVAVLRRQSDGSWRMVIDNPHGQRLMH